MKIRLTFAVLLICSTTFSQIRILFDDTKAEQAGNADWVISDSSNPVKVPTPAQSGISSATPETYWEGALSAWGVDCAKQGYYVETLPPGNTITYGTTSSQDLSKYNVFVVCEPNILFSTAEKTALINFVKNGGGLFIISDHAGSDRNSDGYDSPMIWNDFLTTNSVQANPFGFSFDSTNSTYSSTSTGNFSQTSTNMATVANDSILHGKMGTVTRTMWSNGTSMTLDKTKNSSVQGFVYRNGSSTTGTTGVMFATAKYGNGKVAAIGDSSPSDDGTGGNGNTLYNGYTGDVGDEHKFLLMNATIWLVTHKAKITTELVSATEPDLELYPNPVIDGKLNIRYSGSEFIPSEVQVLDLTGKTIRDLKLDHNGAAFQTVDLSTLHSGVYLCRIANSKEFKTRMITVSNR